jgi:uncharacterized protein DUF3574
MAAGAGLYAVYCSELSFWCRDSDGYVGIRRCTRNDQRNCPPGRPAISIRRAVSGIRSRLGAVLCGILLLNVGSTALAAQSPASACHAGQQARLLADLTFGRDVGRHIGVSEPAWQRFLAREVTPRFPDGLTVMNAFGQWRDRATGRLVREPSKVVMIVLPGHADDQARLDAVVAAYKSRFHQQSVGVILQPACTAF